MVPPPRGSHKTANESISTLLLLGNDEYELQASRGVITFPQWGSYQFCTRVVAFRLALVSHRDMTNNPSVDPVAVPLVITPPFTPRFHLRADHTSSLMTILFASSASIELDVEFRPPVGNDPDSGFDNFHDHITIQTRLAKIVVRLLAMRGASDAALCSQDSFMPRVLPIVRAPSLKLFDQIERESSLGIGAKSEHTSSVLRLNTSSSFHPQKNSAHCLNSLQASSHREPTPPRLADLTSRPPSTCSHGRRTASPRTLDPLVEPTPAARITADINNQIEAREVILRLRARRSALNYQLPASNELTDENLSCPESRLKSKAELEDFNELVMVAKKGIAGDMDKAKNELDFYRSILPRPQHGDMIQQEDTFSKATPLLKKVEKEAISAAKKPTKLPTLPAPQISPSQDVSAAKNNQEASPTKGHRSNLTTKKTTPIESTAEQTTKAVRQRHQQVSQAPLSATMSRLQIKEAPAPLAAASSDSAVQRNTAKKTIAKEPVKSVAPRPKVSAKTRAVASRSTALANDDALDDFDDSDPEIDDAPAIPDDLSYKRRQQEDDEEEDCMMTMKVSC